jgi:hypothetical protein
VTVGAVEGSMITTIEGLHLANAHPVQLAWIEHQVPQCREAGDRDHERRYRSTQDPGIRQPVAAERTRIRRIDRWY